MSPIESLVCAGVGESPCASCLHYGSCFRAGQPGSDLLCLDGCIEKPISQDETDFFFSPLLEKTKAIARRLGPVPMLPRERACISPHVLLLQLFDAPAGRRQGGLHAAAGDALSRQLAVV